MRKTLAVTLAAAALALGSTMAMAEHGGRGGNFSAGTGGGARTSGAVSHGTMSAAPSTPGARTTGSANFSANTAGPNVRSNNFVAGRNNFAQPNAAGPNVAFSGAHHHHGHHFFGGGGFGLYAYEPGYDEGYYDDDGYYDDGCLQLRRVWTPYGWRLRRVDVCD